MALIPNFLVWFFVGSLLLVGVAAAAEPFFDCCCSHPLPLHRRLGSADRVFLLLLFFTWRGWHPHSVSISDSCSCGRLPFSAQATGASGRTASPPTTSTSQRKMKTKRWGMVAKKMRSKDTCQHYPTPF